MFFKKENKTKKGRWKVKESHLSDEVFNHDYPIDQLFSAFNDAEQKVTIWFDNQILTTIHCTKTTHETLKNRGINNSECFHTPVVTTEHSTINNQKCLFVDNFLLVSGVYYPVQDLSLDIENQKITILSDKNTVAQLCDADNFEVEFESVKSYFSNKLTGESLTKYLLMKEQQSIELQKQEADKLAQKQLEDEQKNKAEKLALFKAELEKQERLGFRDIIVTTESVSPFKVKERLGIVSAEYAHRSTVMKDVFAEVSNIGKNRNTNTQNALKQTKEKALLELKKEAYMLGADAVIAVDLDYSEISGAGDPLLFLVINGTAITIEEN